MAQTLNSSITCIFKAYGIFSVNLSAPMVAHPFLLSFPPPWSPIHCAHGPVVSAASRKGVFGPTASPTDDRKLRWARLGFDSPWRLASGNLGGFSQQIAQPNNQPNKHTQTHTDTNKRNQTQANTIKHKQAQTITNEHKQT